MKYKMQITQQRSEYCVTTNSVKFTSAHLYGNVYIPVGVARALTKTFDSSDLGLLVRFPALDADESPCKI